MKTSTFVIIIKKIEIVILIFINTTKDNGQNISTKLSKKWTKDRASSN